MSTPTVRNEYIRLASGELAHFTTAGETGPALVVLHGGLPGSSGSAGWSKLVPELASRGIRVFAPDLPGFGQADIREKFHPVNGLKSWADFVIEFTSALGLEEFYLGGNSQGAQISALVAANHFEKIKGLFLISTAGISECIGINWPFRERGDWPPRYEGTEESMRLVLQHVVRSQASITDELVSQRYHAAQVQKESYAKGVASRHAAQNASFKQWMDLSTRLNRLEMPIIYLHGINDRLLPLEGVQLQEDALNNVQYFYIEDCGHQAQTDQPEIVNNVIAEFVGQGKVSAESAARAGMSTRRPPLSHIVESAPALNAF
ncbi:alpha/beta fold hydrolase [Glutamicibacter uratoxydans]|uniref:alpha/beta fold hydrolase n=1 Tax=Glutamicibacter uratoxydans TaxID=43667 RepID=UPI003D6F5B06